MRLPSLRGAVAVLAAALCGGAATYLTVPQGWSSPAGHAVWSPVEESSSAGPVEPSGSASTASAVPEATGLWSSSASATDVAPDDVLAVAPAPIRLAVERLGIDLPVVPEGVDARGRMALPEDPGVAGWYRFGPAPASTSGAVVVAAHVDSRERGVGPFARLSTARPGDRITVQAGSVQWRYDVQEVVRVNKNASDVSRFFARDGAPRLHIVTCTGRYDPASGYEANLVVIAARTEDAS